MKQLGISRAIAQAVIDDQLAVGGSARTPRPVWEFTTTDTDGSSNVC